MRNIRNAIVPNVIRKIVFTEEHIEECLKLMVVLVYVLI